LLSQITDVNDLEKSKALLMWIDLNSRDAPMEIEKKVKQHTNDLFQKRLKMDEERNQKKSRSPYKEIWIMSI
jgi:hypothetical protein